MAISLPHYQLLKLLKERGELPHGGRILEIGKATWYGDAPPRVVSPELKDDTDGFLVVDVIYETLWGVEAAVDIVSIDMDPAATGALKWDVNSLQWPGDSTYATVINHGTAEHIFNIANVFKVMHDACAVGGLMIHESPFTGWTSHGFFCLQPPLFYDVARANGYEMVLVATEHLRSRTYQEWESHDAILNAKLRDQLADHLMLFVAMRKKTDEPFKIPTQGVYCGAESPFVVQMWGVLR